MDIKIEFTDKEISPWGGMSLMKKVIERSGINKALLDVGLPSQGSNRGYNPHQLINNFWVSVWSGANKFEHLEVTRQDVVLQKIFGWERMAGYKSFQRYFQKFSQGINHRVFTGIFSWFFSNIQFDNYTLDLDSTILTRYGSQEGAKRGYNPRKPGRNSHHPIIAFVSELRMVSNFWLRSGDSYTTNNFYNFLENTIERMGNRKIGLLRADSGFYDQKILEYMENREERINYIISGRFYSPVKKAILNEKTFVEITNGIEIAEQNYKAPGWDKKRRIIIVRQDVEERPKAKGKQLELFDDGEIYKNYRYSFFVTNLDLPAEAVWNLYRLRADAENRIKELKEDFGCSSFNMKNFYATEAALNFVMLAYNLMSLFRQVVLKSKQQLKTLRYKLFSIASYIRIKGNQRILKLSLAMKRRVWFMGIWEKSNYFNWHFET